MPTGDAVRFHGAVLVDLYDCPSVAGWALRLLCADDRPPGRRRVLQRGHAGEIRRSDGHGGGYAIRGIDLFVDDRHWTEFMG